jgi:hypothetical protein
MFDNPTMRPHSTAPVTAALVTAALAVWVVAPVAATQVTPILTVMAGEGPWSSGTAFMCVESPMNVGITQECFGFQIARSGTAAIAGPSSEASEFPVNATKPSVVKEAVVVSITLRQKDDLYAMLARWNREQHSVSSDERIRLVDQVARLAGLSPVRLFVGESERAYVKRLSRSNVVKGLVSPEPLLRSE